MRFAILGLLVSASAFATEYEPRKFKYTQFSDRMGNQSYYDCEDVRRNVISSLKALGATDLNVNCYGGLNTFGGYHTPNSISAKFSVPVSLTAETARKTTVNFRPQDAFYPACDLNVGILEEMLPLFPNVTVVTANNFCFDGRTRWNYSLEVLR
ncbi:MAG TPA: hypothetical protein VNJ01_02670 [Bacteriovoracaceae bacterium]|nr:hypothetical protein [Bacteriovoracaceae bacterium]